MMSGDVTVWLNVLSVVSALNILIWCAAAALLQRRRHALVGDVLALRRTLLLLSAGYVLGCAFRSNWPVYDIGRQVAVDSWLSSVLIGRAVATVAELCFVAQWALMLRSAAHATHCRFGAAVARWLVPLIMVAELFSWHAVLTTSNLGHVVEESIWGLCALLLALGAFAVRPRCEPRQRALLALWCTAALVYALYMFGVDVPMYWSRWQADQAAGRLYLDLTQGLLDAASRRHVSLAWHDWRNEVLWMSLYFSVAVWLSIALVHVPLPRVQRATLLAAVQDLGALDDARHLARLLVA
jgi:hypothetical protein